jgi:3-hydroxyisobutyrate dehydrogenase/2-hydroxy-3-oxopropionate reductase
MKFLASPTEPRRASDDTNAHHDTVNPAEATVGVIGLGAMGSRIARRLLESGHRVTVWNRTTDRSAPLAEAGALVAATPAALARGCDVVLTMVADSDALMEVAVGRNGVASNVDDETVWLEMSTGGPAAIAQLASMLDDDSRLLEAPVLGSLSEVEHGTLIIFVAGPRFLADQLAPLLSVLGNPQYVGSRGAGSAAKLVANLTLLGTIAVLGESLALAEALSLPAATTFSVLESTPLAAQARRRKAAIATGDYPKRFALALACKDAHLIAEAANSQGLQLPLAAAVAGWLDEAVAAGLATADYSALIGYVLSTLASGNEEAVEVGAQVSRPIEEIAQGPDTEISHDA